MFFVTGKTADGKYVVATDMGQQFYSHEDLIAEAEKWEFSATQSEAKARSIRCAIEDLKE